MSLTAEHHPSCRQEIEHWLQENHASYSFEVRPLGDFDVDASLHNQARIGIALNKTTSANYRIAMDRGAVFPAVIAYWKGRKLVIIDGNHRLDAHMMAGNKQIPVYIVEASPEIIIGLTYSANVINGLPTSQEERQIQAVHLLDMDSTVEDAAAKLGLSESAVKSAWARAKADRRASTIGIRGWNKIAITARERLGNIRTDEGMKAAAELVSITPVTAKEVGELVTEINRSRSGAGQVEYVRRKKDEWDKRIQSTAGNTVRKPNLTAFARFMGVLTNIDRLDVREVARTANITQDPKEFNDSCLEAAERLMQIAEAVDEEVKKTSTRANGKK